MSEFKIIIRIFVGGVGVLAVAAVVLPFSATGEAILQSGLDKDEACAYIDCAGGTRDCGSVTGTLPAGGPFVGDEIEVTYTCYEPDPS